MKTLTIITGLPGSGKTTLASGLAKSTMADHWEADMFMVCPETLDYKFEECRLREVHARCQSCTMSSMKKGVPIVVSNTFTRKWEAEPYVRMARDFGYDVVILHVTSEFKSIHGVPPEKIQQMKARREFFYLSDFP